MDSVIFHPFINKFDKAELTRNTSIVVIFSVEGRRFLLFRLMTADCDFFGVVEIQVLRHKLEIVTNGVHININGWVID